MRITIRDNSFMLHYSGAVFWEEKSILLISDVHLGKVSHFRKHGLAIPESAIVENFNRLDEVVVFFDPSKIIFLGDLFHSKINIEWNLFTYWVNKIQKEFILVAGNHDIIDKQNYADLSISIHDELILGEFLLTHHPVENDWFFNFCGHIHPGMKLRGVGRQSLSLACFLHKEKQLILPAFGEFTGKYFVTHGENDKVYGIANSEVIRVY